MSDTPAQPQVHNAPEPVQTEAVQPEAPSEQAKAPTPSDRQEAKRQQMLSNLERGRKTALENRKKRALLKKLEKEENVSKMDADIKTKLLKKQSNHELESELKQLRSELASLKSSSRDDGLKDKQIATLKEDIQKAKSGISEAIQPKPVQPKPHPVQPKPQQPKPQVVIAPPKEDVVYSTYNVAPW